MPKTRKPKAKTQSITIKDVPTEYVEMFNELVEWFPRTGKQIHTTPKATQNISRTELRTLFFCELVHQQTDKVFGRGVGEERIEHFKDNQKLLENNQS